MERSAVISGDGRYRYRLDRSWQGEPGGQHGPRVLFVMLNPSSADARIDDPTVRRCVGFARRWGYTALMVVNLFALRTSDPRELLTTDDPVGPLNDSYIRSAGREADLIVCAWGARGSRLGRDRTVLETLRGLVGRVPGSVYALGLTANGQPQHPLYVPADRDLVPL